MIKDFNKKETVWLQKLRKVMLQQPASICMYVVTDSIVACKKGVSGSDLSFDVGIVAENGTALSDIHDQRLGIEERS